MVWHLLLDVELHSFGSQEPWKCMYSTEFCPDPEASPHRIRQEHQKGKNTEIHNKDFEPAKSCVWHCNISYYFSKTINTVPYVSLFLQVKKKCPSSLQQLLRGHPIASPHTSKALESLEKPRQHKNDLFWSQPSATLSASSICTNFLITQPWALNPTKPSRFQALMESLVHLLSTLFCLSLPLPKLVHVYHVSGIKVSMYKSRICTGHCTLVVLSETYVRLLDVARKRSRDVPSSNAPSSPSLTTGRPRSLSHCKKQSCGMQWSMVLLTSITQKKTLNIKIISLYKYRAPAERGTNSLKDLRTILDLLMSNLSMSNLSFPRHQSRHGLPQMHWWRLVWDAIFDLVACSLRVSGSVAPVAMTNNHLWVFEGLLRIS